MKSAQKPPNRFSGENGFKGKTLLVTGGTGFLGMVFIEKVLRTCPSVNKIYVLVRVKKGKNPQERIENLFCSPLFKLLIESKGKSVLEKVVAVPGNISQQDLGLHPELRRTLIEEVQIIYHMAANVKFNETFKNQVLLNVRGTKLILQLAEECKNLLAIFHISTVYCYPNEKILHEKTYQPPADPNVAITIVETMSDSVVEKIGNILTHDYPNTYAYSKALAEGLINEAMEKLPVVLIRPSVVVPVWRDPLPGWTNSLNGPVGILFAAGRGVLRTMVGDPDAYADFIPADVVANTLISSTYDYINCGKRRIFNLTTTAEIKVTWAEILELGRRVTQELPLNWALWYPGGSLKRSKLHHYISMIFFHYIPAAILDSLLILTRNKPVLWKIQRRISNGCTLFEYYMRRKWEFNNDVAKEIRTLMNETEKELYNCDVSGINTYEYFYNAVHATRLYIVEDGDDSIPTARKRMKMMWALDRLCKIFIFIGVAYALYSYFLEKY